MKIGFVVNDIATEMAYYTTTRLAMAATQMGHSAWLMGTGDLAYEPDGTLTARARGGFAKSYRSLEKYLADVQKPDAVTRIGLDDFDVIMLRNDPADDITENPWAMTAGVAFGRLIADTGVLVVNDPDSLSGALSKAYFQQFPEVVRPRTLISRDEEQLTAFVAEMGGKAVMKPLQGSGGSGVFLVSSEESPNLSQIIEAISRDGYVVAQEFLPAAKDGDVRLFVMNGLPLQADGAYAAFRRVPSSSNLRSNMSAGGKGAKAILTDDMLAIIDAVRPKLVDDGMFLVGLDIVGDKLMEVNVFSPGGLGTCLEQYGVDFAPVIIADLEHKVRMRHHYGRDLANARLATL